MQEPTEPILDVLISRADAHKMELSEMDANGNLVRGEVRFWVCPFLENGTLYKVVDYKNMTLEVYNP